jgi:PAS domain-containing protein
MRSSFSACAIAAPGARLTETVDLIPAAALELDEHGAVLAANALALTLFGCTSDGLLGAPVDSYLPLGDLLAYDGERAYARLEGRRANGVPVIVDTSVRRVVAGGERRALCVLQELNFGALATEAQRYFDAAFDHAPIGMALFNPDGQYVRVNDALCTMLGRAQHGSAAATRSSPTRTTARPTSASPGTSWRAGATRTSARSASSARTARSSGCSRT